MKYLTIDFFTNFQCLGSECPYTCCSGWPVSVDSISAQKYLNTPGEFGQKLRDNLILQKGSYYFRMPDSGCCFLTDNKLCEIYQQLGRENMCHTCTYYPRNHYESGDLSFLFLSISCPEVARMLLSHTGQIQFGLEEDTIESTSAANMDWTLFNLLVKAFTTCINLLQDRSISLSERLGLVLLFNNNLQLFLESGDDAGSLFHVFSSPENYKLLLPNLSHIKKNPEARAASIAVFEKHLSHFGNVPQFADWTRRTLSFLESALTNRDNDPLSLKNAPEASIAYEQYCVYFLFRYYMRSYADKYPKKRIIQLIHMLHLQHCLTISNTSEINSGWDLQIEVFSRFSRIFDHSETALNTLYDLYSSFKMADTNYCLLLL